MCNVPEYYVGSGIVYPSTNAYPLTVGITKDTPVKTEGGYGKDIIPVNRIVDAIVNRTLLYIVFGCFTYTTFRNTEFTMFCVMLDPRFNNDADISKWQFSVCPYGNEEKEQTK